jgi:hypothetical protein
MKKFFVFEIIVHIFSIFAASTAIFFDQKQFGLIFAYCAVISLRQMIQSFEFKSFVKAWAKVEEANLEALDFLVDENQAKSDEVLKLVNRLHGLN